MKVIVVGPTGFVGSAVAAQLEDDYEVHGLHAPRIIVDPATSPTGSTVVEHWQQQPAYEDLVAALGGASAVVNCAGLAAPGSRNSAALLGANAAMPALLYAAAEEAGVERLVHVSSAAVQGRRRLLDESNDFDLITPYAASKAAGEELLEAAARRCGDTRLLIYRATSVQGAKRSMTASLARFARLPVVPVVGSGSQPLPLALISNVAAAIGFLLSHRAPAGRYVHPWEGMTVARILAALGGRGKRVHLPERLVSKGIDAAFGVGRLSSGIAAIAKRAELLALGQGVGTSSLTDLGFVPPVGYEGYEQLGLSVAH